MFLVLSREIHRELHAIEEIMFVVETEAGEDEIKASRDTTTVKVTRDSGA